MLYPAAIVITPIIDLAFTVVESFSRIISDENLFAVWAINAAGLAWIPARFLTVRIFSVTVALPLFLFFGLNKSLLFHSNLSGRLQFLSNVKYSG